MKLDAIHPHQKPYQSVISTDLTESVMREANLSARWCVVHEPAILIPVLPPQLHETHAVKLCGEGVQHHWLTVYEKTDPGIDTR